MKPKIFIDGQAGTTGLELYDLLRKRKDINLISIKSEHRKDILIKKEIMNSVDLVVLCLPDKASIEAVKLIKNNKTKILDGVFIGSNAALIAPVKIGRDSIVGAGSVITKNVKDKSLALTRSNQIEIKNYKRK